MPGDGPSGSGKALVDEATISGVRGEIRAERRWKELVSSPTNEFVKAIGPRFDQWARVLIDLSASDQRAEADSLCADLVALRDHLGPGIVPVERWDSFVRDRFWVAGKRVDAAQFFQPVRLHPGDGRIENLYRFSVYEADQVVLRYFLERATLADVVRNVIGVVDAESGEHREVWSAGGRQPSYWEVKQRVVSDLASSEGSTE